MPLLTSEAPEPSPEWLRSRLDELGHRTTATDDELRDLFDRLSTGRPLPRPNPLRTAATLLASGLVSRLQDLGLLRTDRLGRLAVDRAVRSALEPLVPEDAPPDARPDEAKIARWAEAASAALERVREDVTLEVLEVPDLAPLLRELVAPDHGR